MTTATPGAMRRSATAMGAWTAVSRAFGFGRVLVIAAVLGTTYLGNAFTGANAFSNIVFELLAAGALSAVLVPPFVRMQREASSEVERRSGELLGVALVVLGAIAVVGVIAAPQIADVLTTSVEDPLIAARQADLMTFLLRFFVPQIVLYGWGAIAIVMLHTRRHFAVTAAAPIANTLVMVAFLVWFAVVTGGSTVLPTSTGARLLLAGAGTLGVAGYVGVLVVALERTGFRLRPRWPTRSSQELRALIGHSAWGVLLHTTAGALLAVAVVVAAGVEGGVVAYQVAFVFFLAPYAILAQPIHTAVAPELAEPGTTADRDRFSLQLSWALDAMATLLVPVTVAAVVFARPLMELAAFGNASERGPALMAAAFATLALGLVPYSLFILFARGSYALGDSRAPALVAIAATVGGIVTMVLGAIYTEGAATLAAIGVGHTVAYLVGAVALASWLRGSARVSVVPRSLGTSLALSIAIGLLAWLALHLLAPSSPPAAAAALVVVGGVSAAAYLLTWRRVGRRSLLGVERTATGAQS